MAHSFVNCMVHVVFSTKGRKRHIDPELEERLLPYMASVARMNDFRVLAMGGTEDHVHLLFALPGPMPIAKAVQFVKGGASKWVHDTFPERRDFGWQEGYGAFSVGISQREDTVRYINRQKDHHKKVSFKDEYRAFLKKHGIEYAEEHIWG